MSGKEWVLSLPALPQYALTAFGEGHLKDFIDESNEIIENLTNGLLDLEENPTGKEDLVNDLFRYFHNMKGNSGIIGYHELNALTHEAETLLNNIRQSKITPTHELIDLLLLVVDVMEALVQKIEVTSGNASPFQTELVVKQLQAALAGGPIELPSALRASHGAPQAAAPAEQESAVEVVPPTIIPVGTENDDAEAFRVTVRQQFEIIRAALETLKKDGSHKESIDAIYRCLVAVKNACAFVGLDEIKVYAERTSGIVDQGRSSGIDFSLMIDLLDQEVSIIEDMVQQALDEGKVAAAASDTPAPAAPVAPPATEEKKSPQPEAQASPAPEKPAAAPAQQAAPPPKAAPVAPAAPAPSAPASSRRSPGSASQGAGSCGR